MVLPAPDGPTSATICPGSTVNDTSWRTCCGRRGVEDGHGLERREGHLVGRRVAERDVVELDGRGAPRRRVTASGFSSIIGGRSSTSKTRSKDDQRGHHVDADVGQRGERPVEPAEQAGQRDERADGERAVDREVAAHAVDQGRGEGRRPA